jgi:hypothetical protein
LIPGARQSKHGTNGFGFAEASGHIDGSAIRQRYHGADTGDCHQTPAHLISEHHGTQLTRCWGNTEIEAAPIKALD